MVASEFIALLDEVYHTGQTRQGFEAPVLVEQIAKQPRIAYFNFTYSPYQVAGQTTGVSIFAYEVTEQIREREARRGELQHFFAQAPVGICVLRGRELVIELANAGMEAVWGRSPSLLIGRPLFEVLPEAAGQGFEHILAQVLDTGEPFLLREAPFTMAHAHQGVVKHYYDCSYQPICNTQDQPTGIICIVTQVTDQVLARQQVQDLNQELAATNEKLTATNEELHQSNIQLTRTNVDLDTFVYTASHDLKAPITNIEGLLDALRYHLPADVQADELTSKLLGMMQGAVERFRFTINQLTDVSRLQQAQDQPLEQVPLALMVEDVRLDLQPLLLSMQGQLTIQLSSGLHVYFSLKNLRSVVYNLLSNALKYHQPGRPPVVRLEANRQGPWVVLTVADNGLGLSERQQARLFGLFQRLHTHVEGTGVGLYMVKRMVENAGGTITVHSQLGEGTTFTVMFHANNT